MVRTDKFNYKILIACEESQTECTAFRNAGFEAYSCDVSEPSGGHPEWHIQTDCTSLIGGGGVTFQTADGETHTVDGRWDLIIAHPPCTYLTNASAVRMRVNGVIQQARYEKAMEAKEFFMTLYNADCEHIAVENPTPLKLVELPPYTQAIQPYEYGHPYSKRTCLWLKNLPKLIPTNILSEHEPYVNGGCKDAHGNYRRFQGRRERDPKTRSKSFQGIAEAMAAQWGSYLIEQTQATSSYTEEPTYYTS